MLESILRMMLSHAVLGFILVLMSLPQTCLFSIMKSPFHTFQIMTTLLLFTYWCDKNCWDGGCPKWICITEQRSVPQTHGNWQSLPPVYVQMLTQCTKNVSETASLQRLPTKTSYPLSPAINNRVFDTPEHVCVSVLSSLIAPVRFYRTKPCWMQWKMFLKMFLKIFTTFLFLLCLRAHVVGYTCGAQRTICRASWSLSTSGFLGLNSGESDLAVGNFFTHWGTELLDCGNDWEHCG